MKNLNKKLSYTLYMLLVAFLMVGCELETEKEVNEKLAKEYSIIEIEGCEYIMITKFRLGYMAHKGNCKNH